MSQNIDLISYVIQYKNNEFNWNKCFDFRTFNIGRESFSKLNNVFEGFYYIDKYLNGECKYSEDGFLRGFNASPEVTYNGCKISLSMNRESPYYPEIEYEINSYVYTRNKKKIKQFMEKFVEKFMESYNSSMGGFLNSEKCDLDLPGYRKNGKGGETNKEIIAIFFVVNIFIIIVISVWYEYYSVWNILNDVDFYIIINGIIYRLLKNNCTVMNFCRK